MGITTSKNTYVHYPSNFPCNQLEETSYSDLNSLSNCISYIKGQKSMSASSTDIYILEGKKNKNTMFMKLFISGIDNSASSVINVNTFKENIYPLIYEYGVYMGKINKLVNYNICPFFVTTKGGKVHNEMEEVLNFLNGKLKTFGSLIDIVQIEKNFVRNIKTIINNMSDITSQIPRLAIDDTSSTVSLPNNINNLVIDKTKNYQFGYFITEGFNNSKTASDIFHKNLLISSNLNNLDSVKVSNLKQLLLLFIFQMAIAFKTLGLSKISNCDIHVGNILFDNEIQVSNLSNVNLTNNTNKCVFFVENKNYTINLPFLIKIYDFDRSYVYGDNTPDYEIKNTHFSIEPTYNKSTLRDFLFPIISTIGLIYEYIYNFNITTQNTLSDLLNTLSDIFLIPSTSTSLIPIIITDPTTPYKFSFKNYESAVSYLYNDPKFKFLNNNARKLGCFYFQTIQPDFISKSNIYEDRNIRNKFLHDSTFDSKIFRNFDDIIDNVYGKIDNRFKNICTNNNTIECIKDADISKYYLNKAFFDIGGVLNKKDLYKTINNTYSTEMKNFDNKILKKDKDINTLNSQITNLSSKYKFDLGKKDTYIQKRDIEIQALNGQLTNISNQYQSEIQKCQTGSGKKDTEIQTLKTTNETLLNQRKDEIQRITNACQIGIKKKDTEIQKLNEELKNLQSIVSEYKNKEVGMEVEEKVF